MDKDEAKAKHKTQEDFRQELHWLVDQIIDAYAPVKSPPAFMYACLWAMQHECKSLFELVFAEAKEKALCQHEH